jgi:SPP1 family predicted phage head-tail adaptor
MQAGKMDKKITLQRSSYVVDPAGTPTTVWTNFATVRAQVIQSGTEEFIRAYGASEETAIIFRTRFRDDVTLADRILYAGKAMNLKEINEIQRRRGLEIRATALN